MEREILETLGQCSLFQGMASPEIETLCGELCAVRQRLSRGERLWLKGDAVRRCGVVLSGRLRAEEVSGSGRRHVAALHGPGAVFGDVLMVTRAGHSPVDLIAAEAAEVLLLSYESIMAGSGRDVALLRENLLDELAEKYWLLRRRLRYMAPRSLRARVARRLLDAAARGNTFSLGCTREELADQLGVNRSALSRELSRMRQEGLLDFYRDSFRLLDRPALEEAADPLA